MPDSPRPQPSIATDAAGVSGPSSRIELLATCTFGLEAVVARELEGLGYDAAPVGTGRVLFTGDHRAIGDANLWLRAADRVLIRVGRLDAGDFDSLFEGVKALPWERWIAREAAFPVSGRCVRSTLSSEPAVQRATKRAIVDRLKGAYGPGGAEAVLPETGPRVAVEVSILKDVATLTIDTSGAGLHKRGYREGTPGEAALKETLAAGLVLLSVWRPGRPLVDPFCGSGTIAIEAAMIGRSIAPGLRRSFDAERWLRPGGRADETLIGEEVWREAREEAEGAVVPDRLDPVIHASDVDERALRLARDNAREAGVERDVQFLRRDVKDLSSTLDHGVVVTNPPYGERLGDPREIERLYRSLPGVFRRLPTWSFHLLTGVLDLERLFGQDATRRRKLYNSTIECGYFSFLGPKPPSMRREQWDEAPPQQTAAPTTEVREGEKGGEDRGEGHDPEIEATPGAAGEELGLAMPDDPRPSSAPAAPEASRPLPGFPRPSPPPRSGPPSDEHRFRETPRPTFGGLRDRDEREAVEFGRCLANNLRHLRRYPARGVLCYRVYERDVPDVPLIVDRYADWYHAAEYEREHSRTAAQQADWFDLMRRTIARVAEVPPERVVMKEKHRQRGLTQHEKVGEAGRTMAVAEGTPPLRFEVNLHDYVDTGLFLDHRLTRDMVRREAAGKRFLNLFCYTGSFTVYAASGGAADSTSVDLSNTYLDWARRNLGLNNLWAPRHALVRSDVLEFLRQHPPGERYDLAVVDPPTFSNSKSTQEDWEVARAHTELLGLLAPLMSPGGVAYFSTNYRRFKLDEDAVAAAGWAARNISSRTVPPEYRNRRIHLCWRMVRGTPDQALAALEARRARGGAPAAGPAGDEDADAADE